MRELPRVTVLGDTTGGASANPAVRTLAGGWSFTVSRWIARTADGAIIEDGGIPPDVFVGTAPADFDAGIDPVLERALELARAPSNPS
jgi:C-terminal processing protease CtpA/Prc